MRILEAIRSLLDPGIGKVNKLPKREVFDIPLPDRWCGCHMSPGESEINDQHTKWVQWDDPARMYEACSIRKVYRWTPLTLISEVKDTCES